MSVSAFQLLQAVEDLWYVRKLPVTWREWKTRRILDFPGQRACLRCEDAEGEVQMEIRLKGVPQQGPNPAFACQVVGGEQAEEFLVLLTPGEALERVGQRILDRVLRHHKAEAAGTEEAVDLAS